ncbi:MAG: DUF559 domain-containing protein [Intrasporangiaceae bacterium]|nr:DUF559 domain-containing protein [Intrasporangiaceae bacterium]
MDAHRLDELAAPRAGIVARADLVAIGWSRSRVDRRVRSGDLLPLAPGVFRVAGAPWTRTAATHAALLIAGTEAHLARWSAAERHGFREPHRGPVHVVVPRGSLRVGSYRGLLDIQHTRSLPDIDRNRLDGIAVTSAARTLLDLAPYLSSGRLAELAAAAIRLRCCRLGDLDEILHRRTNAHGRRRLRQAVQLLGEDGVNARAEVEIAALEAIVNAGLPRPVVAFRVRTRDGVRIAEVDLAYPEHRLAIEIDGFRWHSSPARKRADEERQNRLVVAGWTVLRFSASEVRTHPDRFVATIERALAAARVTP